MAEENNGGIISSLNRLWNGNGNGQQSTSMEIFSLTKKQRIAGFFLSLFLGAFCFILAFILAPFIVLKAKKFVILFTFGSLFSLGSFSFLWGPWSHIKHLFSLERLPFTITYIGSIVLTLWSALWMKSTILAVIFAVVQIVALLWFILSYIPGGTTGLKFMSKLCSKLVTSTVSESLDV